MSELQTFGEYLIILFVILLALSFILSTSPFICVFYARLLPETID